MYRNVRPCEEGPLINVCFQFTVTSLSFAFIITFISSAINAKRSIVNMGMKESVHSSRESNQCFNREWWVWTSVQTPKYSSRN